MTDQPGAAPARGSVSSGATAAPSAMGTPSVASKVLAAGVRSSSSPQRATAPRKRIRNFTADDRAAHRVFEKSRREAFKNRLIELASLIPALVDTDSRRLSKHVVVDESIARHKLLYSRCETAIRGIRMLLDERDSLLDEVNRWRAKSGVPMRECMMQKEAFEPVFEAERDMFIAKMHGENGVRAGSSQRASSSGILDDVESHVSGGSASGDDMGMVSQKSQPRAQQQALGQSLPPGVLDPSLVGDGPELGGPGAGPVSVSVPGPAAQTGVMGYARPDMAATTMADKSAGVPAMHHHDTAMEMGPHPIFSGFELGALPSHHQQQHPQHQHGQHPQHGQHAHTQHGQHGQHPHAAYMQQHGHPQQGGHHAIRHHHGGVVSPIQEIGYESAAHGHQGHLPHAGHGHGNVHGGHAGHVQQGQHPMMESTTQAPYIEQLASIPYLGNMSGNMWS